MIKNLQNIYTLNLRIFLQDGYVYTTCIQKTIKAHVSLIVLCCACMYYAYKDLIFCARTGDLRFCNKHLPCYMLNMIHTCKR